MKVNWIIQNQTKDASVKELLEACERAGHNVLYLDGDIMTSHLWPYKKSCVIFNGSIEMSKMVTPILKGSHCAPVSFNNWPLYECSTYYSHYGKYLFNDRYAMMSLAELGRNRFLAYGTFGKEGLIFVRPSSGEKTFQAQLLDIIDLDRFIKINECCQHDLVVVSTPKNIKWEGRFVVSYHNKEIIAHSTYKFQDQITKIPAVPAGATKKCQEILNDSLWFPDPVFCIDLCEDSDGNFWLLELTSFSSCGLYACNKDKIAEKVSEIALDIFNKEIT